LQTDGGITFAAEVLQSPLIQRLREEKMVSERKLAEFNRKYQVTHPDAELLRDGLEDLDKAMKSEVQAIIKGFEDDVAVAKARETELETSVPGVKQQVAGTNEQLLDLDKLEREAGAQQELLRLFLSRLAETSSHVDPDNLKAGARIISHADVPIEPSFPDYKISLSVAFAGSGFLGFLLAFVVEKLRPGFQSGDELEQHVGLPVLALIPIMDVAWKGNTSPLSTLTKQASPLFAESIRNLYVALHLRKEDTKKTVLVTSAEPQEGKTTIATCLATTLALAGRKVVIVDCDFHRPSVHTVFGLPQRPGLREYLTGTAPLDEVCHTDEESSVVVIPAGSDKASTVTVLASDRLDHFLDSLRQRFDYIILDSPPLMAVPDTRILSSKVGTTLFIVRWAKTQREVVALAIKELTRSGTPPTGAVLSMVNAKKHARYGSADSAYYSRSVQRYYRSL
ncbi:MAG: polysaccharide biosynthesis tyrosine autokinase, partial [Pyrinomonadaceae bacterium]